MTRSAWLKRLERSSGPLADDREDLQDFRVTDVAGEPLGTVRGLFVDTANGHVRFIEVRDDPVLGLDEVEYLIPAEAISRSTAGLVRLGHARTFVELAPRYDPDLITDPSQWGDLYAWYGYVPYWALAIGSADQQRTEPTSALSSLRRRATGPDRSTRQLGVDKGATE